MDLRLFSSLIRNLLRTGFVTGSEENYRDFESRYCYNAALQPLYQASQLQILCAQMKENTVYEFTDELMTCLLLVLLEKTPVLIGPFVRREIGEERLQSILIAHAIPASFSGSLKQYLSSFPLLSFTRATEVLSSCLQAFSDIPLELTYVRINRYDQIQQTVNLTYQDNLDYSTIYRRYDKENAFLS